MRRHLFLILFTLVAVTVAGESLNRPKRLIGAVNVPSALFSSVVLVTNSDDVMMPKSHRCTGTVISKHHVLTAAHCLVNLNPDGSYFLRENLRVFAHANGSYFLEEFAEYYIENVTLHRDFGSNFENDVAIIKISDTFGADVIPQELAAGFRYKDDDFVHVLGFGSYSSDPYAKSLVFTTPKNLKMALYKVIRHAKCLDFWPKMNRLKQYCIGDKLRNLAVGDDGAPMLTLYQGTKFVVVGIASFNKMMFAMDEFSRVAPTVITKMNYYCQWIQEVTEKAVSCTQLTYESGHYDSDDDESNTNTTTTTNTISTETTPDDTYFKALDGTSKSSEKPLLWSLIILLTLSIFF